MGFLENVRATWRTGGDSHGSDFEARQREALRLIDEGNTIEDAGRLEIALECYEKAIGLAPYLPRGHLNRGNVLLTMGNAERALAAYATALEKDPGYAEAHFNIGNACAEMGRTEDALAAYRNATALKPDFVNAEIATATMLAWLGRLDQAVASYRHVLEIAPSRADVHCNLGNCLERSGRFDEAAASYRRALEAEPNLVVAHFNLGNVLRSQGKLAAAVESYRQAARLQPDFAAAHSNLGGALGESGQIEEALASCRRAVDISANFAGAHNNLGNVLRDLGRLEESVASYKRALEIEPDFVDALYNLGRSLADLDRLDVAALNYRSAIRIDGRHAKAHCNLGNVLNNLGKSDEAVASYRRALEVKPDYDLAYSNLLFCLSHHETVPLEQLIAEHRRFGEKFEVPLRGSWPTHDNGRDPARPLQVGLVSADLRDHPVSYFVGPILEQLSGMPGLSLHAYYNHATEGRMTPRLRNSVKHWNRISRLTDEALVKKILEDKIDILIDLSGHTGENRLLTFARKPAPVQASWIGYPGTTGLAAMDYYLADRHFLPPGKFDAQFTEKLVYLPANAPFTPDDTAPPVNDLPALGRGYLTFGSFNRLSKLSRSAIALWSHLLRQVPDARMMIAGMPREGKYETLIGWFAAEGVGRERLEFHERADLQTYLQLHHRVDMCLDTFPYTGGTTTFHALWMGVPTLTMAGRTIPGRQGAAILGHLGLEEFVAADPQEFSTKGMRWASDRVALAALRAALRQRFRQSTLCRPDQIATGLEQALRTMWQRWCAGLPPESIDAGMVVQASTPREPGDD